MDSDDKETKDVQAEPPVKESTPAAPEASARKAPHAKWARYTGDGSQSLGGIPARNLKADEWAALTPEQREEAVASGLYVEA